MGAGAAARARLPAGHALAGSWCCWSAGSARSCWSTAPRTSRPTGRRAGPLRRRPRRLRRLDARPGRRRRPAPALRVLGAHDRLLLPADRPLRGPQGQPAGRHAGDGRHHRRRAGDAGRAGHARPAPRAATAVGGARRRRRAGTAVAVAVALLLVGALTKSALVPVPLLAAGGDGRPDPGQRLPARGGDGQGRRLPGRPVRARRSPTWPVWRVVRARRSAAATLLVGGYRALRQHDLKLLLAFGTVSQLGLIVLLVGYGTQATALAGVAMLGAHAMFKAALFLVVGVVDARDRHPRPAPALRAGPARCRSPRSPAALATASMVGLAAVRRLRRQGGRVRRPPARRRRVGRRRRPGRRRGRLGADRRVRAAALLGRVRHQAVPAGRHAPGRRGGRRGRRGLRPGVPPAPAARGAGLVLALLGIAVATVPGIGDDLLPPVRGPAPARRRRAPRAVGGPDARARDRRGRARRPAWRCSPPAAGSSGSRPCCTSASDADAAYRRTMRRLDDRRRRRHRRDAARFAAVLPQP